MTKTEPSRFAYPPAFWTEIIPRMVEAYLLRTVQVDTGGSEANIPATGTLISVFAPHSGWIEPVVIDECFRRVGRVHPIWLTKEENRSLPRVLLNSRAICIDRDSPEPGVVRTIYEILRQPNAALATSVEGTRFGNPHDPEDLSTLAQFKTGMVRIAIKARVPISPVVILGAERVAPHLDRVWQEQGSSGAFRALQQLMAHPQPMQVRFLPPYQDHLQESGALRGRRRRERALLYTTRLRRLFSNQILELHPGYPLGDLTT